MMILGNIFPLRPGMFGAGIQRWIFHFGHWITPHALNAVPPNAATGIIFFLFGAVLSAAIIVRAGNLKDISHPIPANQPQRYRFFLTDYLLSGIAFLITILTTFAITRPEPGMGTAALWCAELILPGILLFRLDKKRGTGFGKLIGSRKEALVLAGITFFFFVLASWDLGSLNWAGTPDESHFFMTAKAFSDGRLRRFILSENGVFGYHPVLSSYYQIIFMKLFGMNVWGWRLSSTAAFAFAIPFLYIFVRELWSRETALWAALFFGGSKLSIGYAHFGYNNVQVYPLITASLAIFIIAARKKSLFGYYLAGIISGLGFYTYYPSRLIFGFLIISGLTLRALPLFRRNRTLTIVLFLGLILTILPIVVHFDRFIADILQQTAVTKGKNIPQGQLLDTLRHYFLSSDKFTEIAKQWFLCLIFGVYFIYPHHFQVNPVCDPISFMLAMTGIFIALRLFFQNRRDRLLLLIYLFSSFAVGAISSYDRPPLTRLLFLTPILAVFSAVTLKRFSDFFANAVPWFRHRAKAFAQTLILASLAWNIGVLNYSIHIRGHGYGDGTTSTLLRLAKKQPADCTIFYVQRTDSYMGCIDLIFDIYEMGDRIIYLRSDRMPILARLKTTEKPILIACDLQKPSEINQLHQIVQKVFPHIRWKSSDPRKPWNIEYAVVPDGKHR